MSRATDLPAVQAYRQWQEQSRLLEQLQIVFIVGPPKCGTTWLRKMLGEHPESIALGEGHFGTTLLPLMQQALAQYTQAHANRAGERGKEAPDHLRLTDVDRLFILRQAIDRCFMRYLAENPPAEGTTVRALMDKTPDHARCILPLATVYPWAKFICISRDVRDAAVSSWHHRELLGTNTFSDINVLAEAYARDVWGPNVWAARAASKVLPGDRYAEVTYEQLKDDPHAHIRRLLEFAGLDAGADALTMCVDKGDFKRLSGRDPGVEAKAFLRKGIVGDWVNELTTQGAERCVAAAQQVLARPVQTHAAAV